MTSEDKTPYHEFQRIAQEGRIDELNKWIVNDRPVRFEHGRYNKPISGLRIAVETGFYSFVESLLGSVEWSPNELTQALGWSASGKMGHLVELLLDFGASAQGLDFFDLAMLMDADLLKRLVQAGADPTLADGFAQALCYICGRPLLRFYMDNRKAVEGLDEQVGMALNDAIGRQKVRAAVLLLWAGADPSKKVPWEPREDFPGYANPAHQSYEFESESYVNAYEKIGMQGDLTFYEKLKLAPPTEGILQMLKGITFAREGSLFTSIVKRLPSGGLNGGERGSCDLLEDIVQREHLGFWQENITEDVQVCVVSELLQRGARWNPNPEDARRIRRGLSSRSASRTVRIVKLLHEHKQSPELLWEVIRTPKLKSQFGSQNWQLYEQVAAGAGIELAGKRRMRYRSVKGRRK